MKTIQCERCKSVMGLIKETPRWELFKCFSCRQVTGRFHERLKQHEMEDATEEMDTYARSLLDEEFQSMSPEKLQRILERNEINKMCESVGATTKTQPLGREPSGDWLTALQTFGFAECRILGRDGGRMGVECVGKFGNYRAFWDEPGETFAFQWLLSHPAIGQLSKQKQDDLVNRVAQASSSVALEFKGDMARVRVQHLGIPKNYDLGLEQSIRAVETVIPILLSAAGEKNHR